MLKIILNFTILVIISVNLFADGTEPIGSGTETDPYQVDNLDNLLWISTNSISWDKYFIQTTDIDASDTQNWNNGDGFSPIGYNYDNNFNGTYNGQNHIIDGLYINRPESNEQGLFGVSINAIIKNIGVTNISVIGNTFVGGLAGRTNENSMINNCYSTGQVSGIYSTGGLFGDFYHSTLEFSHSVCNVNGQDNVGGLIGRNWFSVINNSYSICSVNGETYLGGITGNNNHSTFYNSFYNYDTTLFNGDQIITIGALSNQMFLEWLENDFSLNIDDYLTSSGEEYLINDYTDLSRLWAFGQFDYHYRLTNDIDLFSANGFYIPYFSGNFNGNFHVIDNLNINLNNISDLGLFGLVANEAIIENLGVTNVNVNGFRAIGALVGLNIFDSTLNNCYSTGSVSGEARVGGLVGWNSEFSYINNCYSKCSVSGNSNIGGLLGHNWFSTVSNCFSTGNVIGNYHPAGLVARNENSLVSNCYSIGNVNGINDGKGLIDSNINSIVSNSFWDIETSGQIISNGGTGKTTVEMKDLATYTDTTTVGLIIPWDFTGNPFYDTGNDDFWDICIDVNNGYPYFANPLVGVDDLVISEIPQQSELKGNFPNPFNPTTTISFSIQNDNNVELSIFNIKGQKIKVLVNNKLYKGDHSFIWNGDDELSKPVSSGVYLYYLKVNGKTNAVRKCLLLK